MANDMVINNAIALLNSIRLYDKETPIIMIPYDNKYKKIAKILNKNYNVNIYPDLKFLKKLSKNLYKIFGKKFFARPNQFRKQACWFGPFDEFLYIDTDIIIFEKIIDNLKYLKDYDFVCCDYQYIKGIKNIFTEKILKDKIINEKDIFNAGFWGSKKRLISEEILYKTFEECTQNLNYFDFSQKVSDMPIINYLIQKSIKKKLNLTKIKDNKAGSWAGMPHFKRKGNILIDPNCNQPLKYLHWAGIKIEPSCPYWDIWRCYRFLNEIK